jgi:hypothetical protein
MENVESSQVAYVWTASLTKAIRAEDQTRPVVSGMHSLSSGSDAKWMIQDQGELNDLLTTHPYHFGHLIPIMILPIPSVPLCIPQLKPGSMLMLQENLVWLKKPEL